MKKRESAKITCSCCCRALSEKNFYLSNSPLNDNTGKLPLCKDCMETRYETLTRIYSDEIKALYHLCMNLDIYYGHDLASTVYENIKSGNIRSTHLMKNYIQKVNSLPQYREMTSIDSEFIMLKEDKTHKSDSNDDLDFDSSNPIITPKIRRRWGRGYTDEDYEELEFFYQEYKDNLNHENNFMKLEIIREMCTIKHIRDKAKRTDDFKTAREYSDLLSKKMSDANLKPNQQKNFGESDDDKFSMKMRIIENERPISEPLEEYKDIDGFWKYLNRHMIKPFANALGLAKGEYSIEDGSKDIVYDEKLEKELVGAVDEN